MLSTIGHESRSPNRFSRHYYDLLSFRG